MLMKRIRWLMISFGIGIPNSARRPLEDGHCYRVIPGGSTRNEGFLPKRLGFCRKRMAPHGFAPKFVTSTWIDYGQLKIINRFLWRYLKSRIPNHFKKKGRIQTQFGDVVIPGMNPGMSLLRGGLPTKTRSTRTSPWKEIPCGYLT